MNAVVLVVDPQEDVEWAASQLWNTEECATEILRRLDELRRELAEAQGLPAYESVKLPLSWRDPLDAIERLCREIRDHGTSGAEQLSELKRVTMSGKAFARYAREVTA